MCGHEVILMKQFDALQKEYPELYKYCYKAEEYMKEDPESSLLKAGKALEYMVKTLEKNQLEPVVWIHEHRNDCINELAQHGTIDEDFASELLKLRILCSDALDDRNEKEPTVEDAEKGMALLSSLVGRFIHTMETLGNMRKTGKTTPKPMGVNRKKAAKAGKLLALGGVIAAAALTVIFGSKE